MCIQFFFKNLDCKRGERKSKVESLVRLGVVVLFFILVHGRGLNLFKNLGKASDGVSEYTMERRL